MEDIAGWVAPIATMIAAMMTAANLGARVTGWGFVVFTVGSVAWSIVGLSSGQTNLVATNGVLTLVNALGIWRWLGRQRAYEDGGKSAQAASRHSETAALFPATGLSGMPAVDRNGEAVGNSVEALISCETGELSYVVIASSGLGGIDETLRGVARRDVRLCGHRLELLIDRQTFEQCPALAPGDWPVSVASCRPGS